MQPMRTTPEPCDDRKKHLEEMNRRADQCFAALYWRCGRSAFDPAATTPPSSSSSLLLPLSFRPLGQQTLDLNGGNLYNKYDVLVGYYLPPDETSPTQVMLQISHSSFSCNLVPGRITFAMEGRYMLPYRALNMTNFSAHCVGSNRCMLVTATTADPDLKVHFIVGCGWQGVLRDGGTFAMVGGCFDVLSAPHWCFEPLVMYHNEQQLDEEEPPLESLSILA